MFLSSYPFLVSLLVLFINCIIESASDENLSRYLPASEEDISSTNQRFQQIMQGAGAGPSALDWKPPKLKIEKIDVRSEREKLNTTHVYQANWPDPKKRLGAVSAVDFDKDGNVVIFHRVDRIWGQSTFGLDNVFREQKLGPITGNTVVAFDRQTGKVVYEWGQGVFYMPHGLTIDGEDNVWVTDVALHQVMKFGPRGGSNKPLLTLGTAFKPGSGDRKFCKPTSVAVLPEGDFFVADGYCNARIVKFTSKGEKILSWGHNSFSGSAYDVAPQNFFAIPHALTLARDKGLLCAADRENGRVQCFFTGNGTFHSQYHSQIIGDRLFSMDYTPVNGGQLFIVNGPTAELGGKADQTNEVRGYVMDMKSQKVISKFSPNGAEFSNPHDIAVTSDGNEIYVAELKPFRVHKFINKKFSKSVSLSAAKPTATSINLSANASQTIAVAKVQPGSTALLVGSLILIFALLTGGMALLISRRRKRGKCLASRIATPSELEYSKLVSGSTMTFEEC